jgi:hypothetical protein
MVVGLDRTQMIVMATGAVPLMMESEAGLYDFDSTRFLQANRYPLRSETP